MAAAIQRRVKGEGCWLYGEVGFESRWENAVFQRSEGEREEEEGVREAPSNFRVAMRRAVTWRLRTRTPLPPPPRLPTFSRPPPLHPLPPPVTVFNPLSPPPHSSVWTGINMT